MHLSRPTTLSRTPDAGAAYHLLVALIFAACLPLSLARALGGEADAGTLAGAIDTARAAAARAFSLPG